MGVRRNWGRWGVGCDFGGDEWRERQETSVLTFSTSLQPVTLLLIYFLPFWNSFSLRLPWPSRSLSSNLPLMNPSSAFIEHSSSCHLLGVGGLESLVLALCLLTFSTCLLCMDGSQPPSLSGQTWFLPWAPVLYLQGFSLPSNSTC